MEKRKKTSNSKSKRKREIIGIHIVLRENMNIKQ